MIQSWQAVAQAGLILWIDVCDNDSRSAWKPIKHNSPRIDDHAVAMSLAAVRMVAGLSGSYYIREIFNGAGANQRFPVRLPGSCGESGRGENNIYFSHGTVELGKTQVIANGQAYAPEWGFQRNDTTACLDGFFFRIALTTEFQAKQVHFVIARNPLAQIVINEATV